MQNLFIIEPICRPILNVRCNGYFIPLLLRVRDPKAWKLERVNRLVMLCIDTHSFIGITYFKVFQFQERSTCNQCVDPCWLLL